MFKHIRPQISALKLIERGTNIEFKGRFKDTLAYNHFTEEDENTLFQVREIVQESISEAADLFHKYLIELKEEGEQEIHSEEIKRYLYIFFNEKRDKEYVDKIIPFFNELRIRRYNIGKLIVAFNQLHFFLQMSLFSKKTILPSTYLQLAEALQRAINIEHQVLIEVYTEKIIEQVAEGIARLMDKNSEVMQIKELVRQLDLQNSDIQTVTAATEEMKASIIEVANNAASVAEKTKTAVSKATEGKQVIEKALNDIVHTGETFESIVDKFSSLQNHVSSIVNVVEIIRGIADQTNLLALNASIEAARAGEYGRGFAVVADEVRKLAESTVDSLHQVHVSVENLKVFSSDVSNTVAITAESIKKGVDEAELALPILTEITEDIQQINEATSHTAAISQQQAASVDEISQRMVSISKLAEEIEELGKDTGKTVYELSKMTELLRTEVFHNNIKLSTRALLQLAKTDHILWKWRIYNMILGYEIVRPEDVSSHKVCRLGKWYFDATTRERLESYKSFNLLDVPHQQVHEQARLAAESYKNGNILQAENHLRLLSKASEEVLSYIDDLLKSLE
ncbi:globin-coupled sensor protein [Aneurinibacillus thermoaerophilus]|uniref:globin-coupled sensor protein n=1 Tax=Aneurinibacillus TaxID=55079 RepID=UPI00070C7ADF|nr:MULTISPECIES: globin-coupled sensor protein [Aneurinibacillus]AMA72881.1 chemoreceptor protein [Aneurinibacillus sp. XH2]MED0676608.1 globin-coupled sensor protein [Aneurinibacillus thermoaerophilus]MED0677853.1 globin-coupled sensor protein [Aneurinibacillus thermoaerophilus]MED0762929.1 globin-coupled sensor protein [Aneurinibacillus thermoaerophilus]